MTTTFKSDIIPLTSKTSAGQTVFEVEIEFKDNNLVWLDVSAQEELQLYLAIRDLTKTTSPTHVMIDHAVIPRGAFLTLFSNKLITNKSIIIRTTKKAIAYYESKSA